MAIGNILVKFGRVVFEITERTDTQTDRQRDKHTDIRTPNTRHPYRKRSNNKQYSQTPFIVNKV